MTGFVNEHKLASMLSRFHTFFSEFTRSISVAATHVTIALSGLELGQNAV